MKLLKKKSLDVAEARKRERIEAQTAENAAKLDYLAMMCGVDLPGHEEEEACHGTEI